MFLLLCYANFSNFTSFNLEQRVVAHSLKVDSYHSFSITKRSRSPPARSCCGRFRFCKSHFRIQVCLLTEQIESTQLLRLKNEDHE